VWSWYELFRLYIGQAIFEGSSEPDTRVVAFFRHCCRRGTAQTALGNNMGQDGAAVMEALKHNGV
jgi:hypothetical protein